MAFNRKFLIGISILILILILLNYKIFAVVSELGGYIVGSYGTFKEGSTVYWKVVLSDNEKNYFINEISKIAGKCDQNVIKYTYKTYLICPPSSNNIQTYSYYGAMYCSNLKQNRVVLDGSPSAQIPSPYNYDSCDIIAADISMWDNSFPSKIISYSEYSGSRITVSKANCTSGSTMCKEGVLYYCDKGTYSFTASKVCQSGKCSGNSCEPVCNPNSVKCYGNAYYYLCNSNGEYDYNRLLSVSSNEECINNAIVRKNTAQSQYQPLPQPQPTPQPTPTPTPTSPSKNLKLCSNGEVIDINQQCPPTCGDNICNGGETSSTCLTDCPLKTKTCPDGSIVLENVSCVVQTSNLTTNESSSQALLQQSSLIPITTPGGSIDSNIFIFFGILLVIIYLTNRWKK